MKYPKKSKPFLLLREDGATVVEYIVLVTLIIIALLAVIGLFALALNELFELFPSAFDE